MTEKVKIFSPMKQGKLKKSLFYTLSLVNQTIAHSIGFLFAARTSPDPIKTGDVYINRFWRANLEAARATLYATGLEYLTPGETYVFMSNHESWMDIPAMCGAVPSSLRMVSKVGLTQVPIFGQAMLASGFIAIDRKNRSKAIRQLALAKERLAQGISIWMAPEGTRSRDGNLLPFKKGGFYLARELEKSIVPVYIEGAANVMAPDSALITPNRDITVHFCQPISTTGHDKTSLNQLVESVRQAILSKKLEN